MILSLMYFTPRKPNREKVARAHSKVDPPEIGYRSTLVAESSARRALGRGRSRSVLYSPSERQRSCGADERFQLPYISPRRFKYPDRILGVARISVLRDRLRRGRCVTRGRSIRIDLHYFFCYIRVMVMCSLGELAIISQFPEANQPNLSRCIEQSARRRDQLRPIIHYLL